ncbi:MAG: acyl-CoA dehydrogenase family protein [Acidimicrobiia bacterium]
MELELTSDQEFFAETTRKYLEDKIPVQWLRQHRDDPDGFERAYWSQGAELGWTSLLVGEADGGGSISERGLADLALVAFEFGRHAAPGPLLPSNVVAAALSRWGTDDQKAGPLQGILSGEVVATWAAAEPRPNDRLGAVALDAAPGEGGGFTLTGRKMPVEAGAQSDLFLVAARTAGGVTNLLVPADAPGLRITPMQGLDLSRRFAAVDFDGVAVPASAVVGRVDGAAADNERLVDLAGAIQSAEVVGAMDRCLEITIEWSFNRYSFGRPLASYQELKHRFADMRAWLEAAHAISDTAVSLVHEESPLAAEHVSAAKSFLGVYGPELAQDCVQMHGGIGVTFEHDLHLYLRRIVVDARLYGTVGDHRRRITSILEEREGTRV